jgi:hypothetical protein
VPSPNGETANGKSSSCNDSFLIAYSKVSAAVQKVPLDDMPQTCQDLALALNDTTFKFFKDREKRQEKDNVIPADVAANS